MTPFRYQGLMSVVAILVNLPAFSILFLIDLPSFALGQMTTIRRGILPFLVINASILGVQLLRLGPVQLAMPEPLVDSAVLISEAMVDVHAALVIALPLVFGVSGSGQYQAADS
jgi:hypothetical protein